MYRFFLFAFLCTPLLEASCDAFKSRLGKSFVNGDPYMQQYEGKVGTMRFPEPIAGNKDCYLIDNFRNGVSKNEAGEAVGHFTSALIDITKLKKATLIVTIFYIPIGPVKYQAGHGEMLFEFESGGILTPQGEVSALIHSFEAYRDKTLAYNAFDGLRDKYDSIMIISSAADALSGAAERDHGIGMYPLELDPSRLRALFVNSMEEAMDKELLAREPYHTTRNSCVSNQIRLLNQVLPKEKKIPEWHELFGIKLFKTFASMAPRKIGQAVLDHKIALKKTDLDCPNGALEYVKSRFGQDAILERPAPAMRQSQLFQELYGE